ncbi:LysE family translocator [Arenibaculum sp.]|jgi:threonine/homoserine/homoserine lactone efflux protein|uniref:LysE family translocator n=1 Tax=Arenibaculum sp. TaxID=2865862 RepID=UPI002E114402|nr:LysE family translocator [Arenibaculum sp.]
MDIPLLFAAAFAGFIYGITPGPGVLAVLGIGADRGRRSATAFLAGHLAGDVLWSTLALVSLVGVTTVGSLVFDLLGGVSGIYLFWLGWRAVRVQRSAAGDAITVTARRPFLHGLAFGLTNPKAYPVAVATLTALLSAKAGLLTWAMLPTLVGVTCIGGISAYLILIGLVGAAAVRQAYRRHEILITRASGVMFIGFACHAILHAVPGLMAARRA